MLNILTFNVANYDDHPAWDSRLPLIVQTIVDANADVIGLSEIRYNSINFFNTICVQFWSQYKQAKPPADCSKQDMGDQILTLLRTYSAYNNAEIVTDKASIYREDGSCWEGLSIISRLKINDHGCIPLKLTDSCPDKNQRITQWAEILLPTGDCFYLYNTHFTYKPECLKPNVTETLSLIGENISKKCCLVGDLNATPDNRDIKLLADAGLVDVWTQMYPKDRGYTSPSCRPRERVDYCWASTLMVETLKCVTLVATEPKNESVLYESDHFGLLSNFDIR